jgi:hypothetical protein
MTSVLKQITAVALNEVLARHKGGIDHNTSPAHDLAMITRQCHMVGVDPALAPQMYKVRYPTLEAKLAWLENLEQTKSREIEEALIKVRKDVTVWHDRLTARGLQHQDEMWALGVKILRSAPSYNDPNVIVLSQKMTGFAAEAHASYLAEIQMRQASIVPLTRVILCALGVSEETATKIVEVIIDELNLP